MFPLQKLSGTTVQPEPQALGAAGAAVMGRCGPAGRPCRAVCASAFSAGQRPPQVRPRRTTMFAGPSAENHNVQVQGNGFC